MVGGREQLVAGVIAGSVAVDGCRGDKYQWRGGYMFKRQPGWERVGQGGDGDLFGAALYPADGGLWIAGVEFYFDLGMVVAKGAEQVV